jgi:hypothetical protein
MAKSDKDDGKLISVASRVHTGLYITEPPEDPTKPGLMSGDRSLHLHGASHPLAKNGEMVNHGVDAKIFRRWLENEKAANTPLASLLYEVPVDHQDKPESESFGWQPALDVMSGDEAASQGSLITHEPPVLAEEMAATSDTPQEDTPRSEVDQFPGKRSQRSASAPIEEQLKK